MPIDTKSDDHEADLASARALTSAHLSKVIKIFERHFPAQNPSASELIALAHVFALNYATAQNATR
jgi:hypothetical protein